MQNCPLENSSNVRSFLILSVVFFEILIHQVLGGAQGQATDVEIEARHMLDIKQRLNTLMAANVGKSVEEVTRDTERNNWMFPKEALEYGLIDKILED